MPWHLFWNIFTIESLSCKSENFIDFIFTMQNSFYKSEILGRNLRHFFHYIEFVCCEIPKIEESASLMETKFYMVKKIKPI